MPLKNLEPEISDSGPPALSPFQRTCVQDFYVLKKSIDLSRVGTELEEKAVDDKRLDI